MNNTNGKQSAWRLRLVVTIGLVATGVVWLRAGTFTVINTNGDGPGSLAAAISNVNASAGPHRMDFAIPPFDGTVKHVPAVLTSPRWWMTNTVVIDGFTQPGSQSNTSPTTNNAVQLISLSPGPIVVMADQSGVRGVLSESIWLHCGHGFVEGCELAIAKLGPAVDIIGNGNRVGGATPDTRNSFLGCSTAVSISGSSNVVAGNIISGVYSNYVGVSIGSGTNNVVGGEVPEARNYITLCWVGVETSPNAVSTRIQGNYIGLDPTGQFGYGNEVGIYDNGGIGTLIGGLTAGYGVPPGNVIAASSGTNFLNSVSGGAAIVVGNTDIPASLTVSPVIQGNLIGMTADGRGAMTAAFG